jgi:RNA polymerase sigma factor (sigma-70 family)
VQQVIHYIRKIARSPSAAALTDTELVWQFVVNRDGEAFALLVERHGPMVLGICRRVLRDANDADDAFQTTFLVLARKAGSIAKPELLSNWLYGVAMLTASKTRSQRSKRFSRLDQLGNLEAPRDSRADFDLSSTLHDEVHRLPAKYRTPIVLCYFEGQSNEEAARRMGCPTGTVQSRLAWARKRLRHRLTQQGFVLSAAVLTRTLRIEAAPVPVAAVLREWLSKAALDYAANTGLTAGAISPPVAALAQGVSRTMFMIKVKTALAGLLVLFLVGAFAGVMARPLLSQSDSQASSPADASSLPQRKVENQKQQKKKESQATVKEEVTRTFRTGKNATLVLEVFNGGIDVVTGAEGAIDIVVTKESRAADEAVAKEGLKKIELAMTQEGDTIRVKASRPQEQNSPHNLGATTQVIVPPGATLALTSSNGHVTVIGGAGEARIKTSNGSVKLQDHVGAIHVHTSNGPIEATKTRGPLELHTSNAKIEVQSGDNVVNASTSNASIRFNGTLVYGAHTFSTSNGNVQLILPRESQFRVDASTSHGRIANAFKFTNTQKGNQTHLEGQTTANPKISLKVHTSNGNITLGNSAAGE